MYKQYIIKAAALLFIATALSGCMSPQEIENIRRQRAHADAQQCYSYGLQPDTEAFANCRMQLDIARRYPPAYYNPYPRAFMGVGYYSGGHRHRRW